MKQEQGRGTGQISVINTTAQRALWGEGRNGFSGAGGLVLEKNKTRPIPGNHLEGSAPCRREPPNCMLVSAHHWKYSSRSWAAITRDQEEEVKSAALPLCSAPARGLGCPWGE